MSFEVFLSETSCPFKIQPDKTLEMALSNLLYKITDVELDKVILTAKSVQGYKKFEPEAITYNPFTDLEYIWFGRFVFERGRSLGHFLIPKRKVFPMNGMSKFSRGISIYSNYLENGRTLGYILDDWIEALGKIYG